MPVLPEGVAERIEELAQIGDDLADADDFSAALGRYWSAWDLLPSPPTDWPEATWLLGAIGDANFLNADYAAGLDNLRLAMRCPGGLGNPFLHLRLGQCAFELGLWEPAADELARAVMGGGSELFEDEDEKYWEFVASRLEPPPGGW